jgi:glycosyltransferase involved in cell wall biosynthesis
VHTYHGHVLDGYFSPAATRAIVGAERALARGTDAIVAISDRIRRELLETHRIGRASQYHVVPLGFDLRPFAAVDARARAEARAALELSPSAPVVATVGRLTAIKQHDLFLEMAARVHASRPDAVFLVVGDGDLRVTLEGRARELGIADRTRFVGWRRDLPTIYAAADVFALTSRNEGTPVALIEAMAAGVPGVATDVGGVPDVIARADLGILVPFGDAAAMAAAVERLLGDPSLRQRMGAAGRDEVLRRYRHERLVDDIVKLYATLTR